MVCNARKYIIGILFFIAITVLSILSIPHIGIGQASAAGEVTVTITVYDQTGIPTSGANLTIYNLSSESNMPTGDAFTAVTAADGTATFSLTQGEYIYIAQKGIFSADSQMYVATENVSQTVILSTETYTLDLTLFAVSGNSAIPVQGGTAVLKRVDEISSFTQTAISDANGLAVFTGVPKGIYNCEYTAYGFYSGGIYEITVTGDTSKSEYLSVNADETTYSLSIQAKSSGQVIAGATVNISGSENTVFSRSGLTNSDGIMKFTYVPSGKCNFTVSSNGYKTVSESVYLDGNITQQIVLYPIYTTRFSVRNSSAAIPGATVNLRNEQIGFDSTQSTNSDGIVTFANILGGTYSYLVTANGYLTDSGVITVSADNTQHITLVNVYNAVFNVNDGSAPVAGAIVTLNSPDTGYNSLLLTSGNGTAGFEKLYSGTYNYSVAANGYPTVTGSVYLKADLNQNVTLQHIYFAQLSVNDGSAPIAGATVVFGNVELGYSETQITNSDGIVKFLNIKAGTYSYQVSKNGYDSASGSITVTGNVYGQSIVLKATQVVPVPVPGGGGGAVVPVPVPEVPKINITTSVEAKLSNAVLVPGDIQTADGKTVVNISKAEIDALTEAAVKNRVDKHDNVAVINVEQKKDTTSDSFMINMTGEGLSTIIGSKVDALVFRTSTADLELKSEALKGISAAGEDTVSVNLVKIQHNGRPGVDVALAVRGNRVKNFEGVYSVELLIPYEPKAGENTSALFIEYIHDDGATEVIHESRYDPQRKCLVFYTSHFSKYGIAYNAVIFDDVPEYHWANGSIIFLASRGVVEGVGDGNFEPDRMILKTEFIELVTKAFSIIDLGDSAPYSYTDVDINAWYARSVGWSYVNNISNVIAHSDGSLGVDEYITREDMATLINNMTLGTGIYLAEENEAIDFTDSGDMSDYAVTAVNRMSQCGIINGMGDGNFAPKGYCTRAEAATIISNLISKM